jgi:hypothetical protein
MLDGRIIALPVNPPRKGDEDTARFSLLPLTKEGALTFAKKPPETNQRFIVGQIMQMNSTQIPRCK